MRLAAVFALASGLSACSLQINESEKNRSFDPVSKADPSQSSVVAEDLEAVYGAGQTNGVFWNFADDGLVRRHHFMPNSIVQGQKTYFIDVFPKEKSLTLSFDDVLTAAKVADAECERLGHTVDKSYISVQLTNVGLRFEERCVPSGVVLPPKYKSGDRF